MQRKKKFRIRRKPRQVIHLWRKEHNAPIDISANLLKRLQLPERVTGNLGTSKIVLIFEANGTTRLGTIVGPTPVLTRIDDLNVVQSCLEQLDSTTEQETKVSSWKKLAQKYNLGRFPLDSPMIRAIQFLDLIVNQNLAQADFEKYLLHLVDYELHKLCEWARKSRSKDDKYVFNFHWVGSLVGGSSRTEPDEFAPFDADSAKGWFYTNDHNEFQLLTRLVPMYVKEYDIFLRICYPEDELSSFKRRYFPPLALRLVDLRRLATSQPLSSNIDSRALERIQFFVPFADKRPSANSGFRKRILEKNKVEATRFSNLSIHQVTEGLADYYNTQDQKYPSGVDLPEVEILEGNEFLPKDDYIPDVIGPLVPIPPVLVPGVNYFYAHRELNNHEVYQLLRYEDRSRFSDWIQSIQSDAIAKALAERIIARYESLQLSLKYKLENSAIT